MADHIGYPEHVSVHTSLTYVYRHKPKRGEKIAFHTAEGERYGVTLGTNHQGVRVRMIGRDFILTDEERTVKRGDVLGPVRIYWIPDDPQPIRRTTREDAGSKVTA